MKKKNFIQKILIGFMLCVILLAPVSLSLNKNDIKNFLGGNRAEAATTPNAIHASKWYYVSDISATSVGNTSLTLKFSFKKIDKLSIAVESYAILVSVNDANNFTTTNGISTVIADVEPTTQSWADSPDTIPDQTATFNDFFPVRAPTDYYLKAKSNQTVGFLLGNMGLYSDPIKVTTLDKNNSIDQQNQNDPNALNLTNPDQIDVSNDFSCGFISKDSSILGCVVKITYYVVFVPASWVFELTGKLFDFFIGYSLDSKSYSGSSMITEGWKIVRDISNIFFIFILLYVAIATILDLHGFEAKKMIGTVVVIAVLINFSLFFTQVIIDTGNIAARVFYNGITVNGPDGTELNSTNGKQLSVAIVNQFKPQKMFNKTLLNESTSIKDSSGNIAQLGTSGYQGFFIIITLIAAAICLLGAYTFFMSAFIFLGRVIQLWISMIFAPFAFVSYVVPGAKGMKGIGADSWWKDLLGNAFLAPIFIFFIYLIIRFLKIITIINISNDASLMSIVMSIVIPLLIITFLLIKARKIAESLAGDIGGYMVTAAKAVGGTIVGASMGIAAVAGRQTVGRGANWLSSNKTLAEWSSGKKGWVAQALAKPLSSKVNTLSKSSFDVRNSAGGQQVSSLTGFNLNNAGTKFATLDTANTAGGWVGKQARQAQKEKEIAENLNKGYDKALFEQQDEEVHHREEKIHEKEEEIAAKTLSRDQFTRGTPQWEENNKELALMKQNLSVLKTGGVMRKYVEKDEIDPNTGEKTGNKIKVLENEKDADGKDKKTDGLSKMQGDLARIKTAPETEYYANKRRESGQVFMDDERDKNGNIKRFGRRVTANNAAAYETERLTKDIRKLNNEIETRRTKNPNDPKIKEFGEKVTDYEKKIGVLQSEKTLVDTFHKDASQAKNNVASLTKEIQTLYKKGDLTTADRATIAEKEAKIKNETAKLTPNDAVSKAMKNQKDLIGDINFKQGMKQIGKEAVKGFFAGVTDWRSWATATVGSAMGKSFAKVLLGTGGGAFESVKRVLMDYSGRMNQDIAKAAAAKFGKSTYEAPSGGGHGGGGHDDHHEEAHAPASNGHGAGGHDDHGGGGNKH